MLMIFNSEEDLIIAMKKRDQDALKEVIDQYHIYSKENPKSADT